MRSGSDTSFNAAFSFVFCIFTASFTSSTLSWDWDVNKMNQKQRPNFYGYTPDTLKGKVAVFCSLYLMSAFNLLTRSLACVLFYVNGGFTNIAAVLGGELTLYFLVKALRFDLWYWIPIEGAPGVFASFVIRFLIKVVTDWTAVVQFRHPNEVGGAYFSLSMCITIVLGVVAVAGLDVNAAVADGDAQEEVAEEKAINWEMGTITWIMIASCIGLTLSYLALLLSIKREYVWTFFSAQSSNEAICELFTAAEAEDDAGKFQIFGQNRHKWHTKLGEEVENWLAARLPFWLEEQPEWFNEQKLSIIPDDMIDPEMIAKLRSLKEIQPAV
jgi:hypothetical protein